MSTRHRIGIYSGTFDPVHPGHIAFAKEALRVCDLDEVVLLPEQKPRGKKQVTALTHRIALLERVTSGIAGIRAMQLESEQFNVRQTLPELRQAFRANHLTLLVGSDVARTMHCWDGVGVLLEDVSLAIGMRSGDDPAGVVAGMDQLARSYDVSIDYTIVTAPKPDVASSKIRNGDAGVSILHPEVFAYMQEHRLYAGRSQTSM